MRGPIDVLFAFKIFSLPVLTRPGTRTFWQVPDPSRPEVKNPYPSDPAHRPEEEHLPQREVSRRKASDAHPPAREDWGRWPVLFAPT